jgi:hypothetical protein
MSNFLSFIVACSCLVDDQRAIEVRFPTAAIPKGIAAMFALIAVAIPKAVAGRGSFWRLDTIMAGGCKAESTI